MSADRDALRNKARRKLPQHEIDRANEQIAEKTSERRGLRKELKVFRQIEERSGHVRENLEIIDKDRRREQKER